MEVWITLLLIRCVMSASVYNSLLQPASDTDPVRCMNSEPAILGGNVTLTCTLPHPREVIQVTWRKRKGNESKDFASYSKEHGAKVSPEFSAFTSIALLDPGKYSNRSTIEIMKLEKEDEACYDCYFNIMLTDGVHGGICLKDIGLSNELTCSAPRTDIDILMYPPEIKTRKSEHDFKGNSLLKGRYRDPNINPFCIFTGKKKLKEGSDEMVDLQCNATGTDLSQMNWSKTENAVGENKSTDGNVTTITSSLQIPLSSGQRVSCNIDHTTEGNRNKAATKWICPLLAVVVVMAAVVAFYIWKNYKRSSQNSKDKTNEEESQMKISEGTPIKGFSENTDETPEKDFGGKRTENDDLQNHTYGNSRRKLQFD